MQTPATRSELLARRQQVRFAEQGRDLIWDKRTALLREFQRLRIDLLAELSRLAGLAALARRQLAGAEEADGPAAVRSAALASAPPIEAALTERAVAGVRVVELRHSPVRRGPEARGWAPALVSASTDLAAEAYERYLERLLELCALELNVRRLAAEIARSTRQVNALENIVIPRLQAEARTIAIALDEREREERARLKQARAKLRRTAASVREAGS